VKGSEHTDIVMDHSKLIVNDQLTNAYNNARKALDDLLHVAEEHEVDLTDSEWDSIMTSSLWSSRFGDATCEGCSDDFSSRAREMRFPFAALKRQGARMTEFLYACPEHGLYSVLWDTSAHGDQ